MPRKGLLSISLHALSKKKIFFDWALCVLLFLCGLNPFGLNKYFVPFLGLVALFYFFISHRFRRLFTKEFFVVVSFSVSFAIFDGFNSGFNALSLIKNLIAPTIFFLIGRYAGKDSTFRGLACFILGSLTAATINLAATLSNVGESAQRILMNGLTLKYMSATMFSVEADLVFAFSLFVAFSKRESKRWYHLFIGIVGIAVSVYGSIVLQNRSFFLCAIIITLLWVLLGIRKKRLFFILLVVMAMAIIVLKFDVFHLSSIVPKDSFIWRIIQGGSDEARFELYVIFFKNFYRFPFGGLYSVGIHYVHNLVLDIYCVAGFVPFILFLLHLFLLFRNSIITVSRSKSFESLVLFAVFLGLFVLSLFEPVLQANFYVFSLFFLFGGFFERERENDVYSYIRC